MGSKQTLALPDELWEHVFSFLPTDVLFGNVCNCVCKRWNRLMQCRLVNQQRQSQRWLAYEKELIRPRSLSHGHETILCLSVGLDGKIYSGSSDNTIQVWSGTEHIQTLKGHKDNVHVIAAGVKIYSGSEDTTIRVWSSTDGTHLQTLCGNGKSVWSLAIGLDAKVYSGFFDGTIHVLSGTDGRKLTTLEKHEQCVNVITVLKEKVYSGSDDCNIAVWCGRTDTLLTTLVGHSSSVWAFVTGAHNTVISLSEGGEIFIWDEKNNSRMFAKHVVWCAADDRNDRLFWALGNVLHVWSKTKGMYLHQIPILESETRCTLLSMVFGKDGKLYAGTHDGRILVW